MTKLPDPPYPADTKAYGHKPDFDPERIYVSDTWALASNEEKPWLLRIWLESWRSVPCGTMPADLNLLAGRIGCTRQFLISHKGILLRGWILHRDGRLYHPFISEMVLGVLEKRKAWKRHKAPRHKGMKTSKINDIKKISNETLRGNCENSEKQVSTGGHKAIDSNEINDIKKISNETLRGNCETSEKQGKGGYLKVIDSNEINDIKKISNETLRGNCEAKEKEEEEKERTKEKEEEEKETPPPKGGPPLFPGAERKSFNEFWAVYPKKVGKKACLALWKRRGLDRLSDMIIADVIRRRLDDVSWSEGFIPNPQTYLNGDRWEDEIQTSRNSREKNSSIRKSNIERANESLDQILIDEFGTTDL